VTARVLCVDDEKLIRDALTMFLEHLGLEVQCFASGSDCVAEFESSHSHYDLVMVNYDMPGMDGTEVVRKLRTIDARKKIALTSAYPADRVFQSFSRDEVSEFLPKPYNLGKLRRFLQRNLPTARPHALAIVGSGPAARPWLQTLAGAVDTLEVTVHTEPDEALSIAQKGFPNVIVWELDAGLPRVAFLEKLRGEGIPVVFIGSTTGAQSLERMGVMVPARAPNEILIDTICQAARGLHAPQQYPQS
jgi:CheY-like chemotaxis protein